jgi:peptide/nickel transport system ATP-binding protein
MLEVQDLVVRYGSGHNRLTAVDHASLSVNSGETTGIAGESGSGKSTIARAIVGLLPITSGKLLIDGEDFTSMKARNSDAYRRTVQIVLQDPRSSLNPRMTVGQAITEVIVRRGDTKKTNARAEVLNLLRLVGLGQSAIDRFPHQFSGGQAQRIVIARALAVQPKILVLDEVTSALDVSAQATILNLLRQLQKELGISYLLISHDLSVAGYMSDQIAVLYMGQVVEFDTCEEVLRHPRHPYTQALIASIPRFGTGVGVVPLGGDIPDPLHPPSGCRFNSRCPIGPNVFPERTICLEQDPQLIALGKPHRTACHFAGERSPSPNVPAEVKAPE